MPLSEQELLLLDCFMYADLAPKCNKGDSMADIIEAFVDPNTGEVSLELIKNSGIKFSGNMNATYFQDVLTDMRKSEAIKNLKLMETTPEYTGSIRGACFVDADTGKATVAFRGTGGSYQQWYNNFEGYGELSQDTQEDAAAFINSLPYDDIDVTGHSNGGDQAMYVTIVCGDKVSRCVSFEGQGVSIEFVERYAMDILDNKDKITNYCGEKDFVSPLLVDIAGETYYLESEASLLDGTFDHGAYGIYTANREALGRNNGYFPDSAFVEQAWYCKAIHTLTLYLSSLSDTPGVGPALELLTDVLGIVVGLTISKSWTDPETLLKACEDLVTALREFMINGTVIGEIMEGIEAIKSICKNVVAWIKKQLDPAGDYVKANPKVEVDTYKMKQYANRISEVQKRIKKLDNRLDSLYWQVGLLDLFKLMNADLLIGYSNRLSKCTNYLNNTAGDFERVENDLMNKVR